MYKKKLIYLAIFVAVVVCLLAYYHFVPFWAVLLSTAAFIVGGFAGYYFAIKKAQKKE